MRPFSTPRWPSGWGARDYLIKPLNSEQFLDSVRSVVLKMNRPSPELATYMDGNGDRFRLEEPLPEYSELLNSLLTETAAVLGGRGEAAQAG
ncbi:hypothetical protein ACFTAO_31240 [Paenibacillus rhizoplanae]